MGRNQILPHYLMSLIDGVCWIFCIFARESVRERAAPRQNEQVLLLSACTVCSDLGVFQTDVRYA